MEMNAIELRSKFQLIELQHHPFIRGEYILQLDKSWQFDTSLEFRYHESLITIPYAAAPSAFRTLIAGGGDGMAVREALKFEDVKDITLVEIDPEMIRIFKELDFLNSRSLHDERLRIVESDAVGFIEKQQPNSYDIITLDFPSPTSKNDAKEYYNLFSGAILDKFINALSHHGVISSQVSIKTHFLSAYVNRFFERGFNVWYFDTAYDRRGNHDSFLIASRTNLTQERPLPKNLRFVTDAHVKSVIDGNCQLTKADLEHYRLFSFAEQVEYDIQQ